MKKTIQKITIVAAVLFAADISFATVVSVNRCTAAESSARHAVLRRDLADAEKLYYAEYQAAHTEYERYIKSFFNNPETPRGNEFNIRRVANNVLNPKVARANNVRTERRREAYRKYAESLNNCTGKAAKTATAESPATETSAEVQTESAAEVQTETAAEVQTESVAEVQTESAEVQTESASSAGVQTESASSAEVQTESPATESASSSGGSGVAIGAGVAVVGAAAMFLSGGDLSLFSFAPDFHNSAIGGRMDFRKESWHFYYSASQTNGDFANFRYTSGGEYKTDLFAASFSESVAGETADYDFSLSANLQNGIWKISPVYRMHSEYEKGKTETDNSLNLEIVLQTNRWTITPSAGFQWQNDFAENGKLQINAIYRF